MSSLLLFGTEGGVGETGGNGNPLAARTDVSAMAVLESNRELWKIKLSCEELPSLLEINVLSTTYCCVPQ